MRFRLVDKIINYKKDVSIETAKAISFEEFSLLKRWGRKGAFPETLFLQVVVESASLLIARSTDFTAMGVLAHVHQVRFFSQTTPGDLLYATIEVVSIHPHHWEITFMLNTREKPIVDGGLALRLIALNSCFTTKHYALMWKERDARTH